MTADRWRITFDGDQLEDEYDERPSEFVIRQTQRACPDTPVRLWRLVGAWRPELVEERPGEQPTKESAPTMRGA